MKAVFTRVAPYAGDAMNLPVENLEAAIPFYEETFGFYVVSRQDAPHKSVSLGRDKIQIGLAENGGDPAQEGCFFEVDNVEAAFTELKAGIRQRRTSGLISSGISLIACSSWSRPMGCVT